jgi:plastocyanin
VRNAKHFFIYIMVIFAALILSITFPAAIRAGTVKGKVSVLPRKNIPKRVAVRYPGKHSQKPGELEPIPAVVLVMGPVPGFPPPTPPATPKIVQEDFKFQPPLLVVPVNTTVEFPNQDLEFHNVFSYSKTKRFDLGRYPQGETRSVLFDKPGIGKIYCEIHEWMRAVIVVVENPFYAAADENGYFEIKNIPGGTYKFLIWKIDHKQAIKEVNVPDKGTVELNVTLPEKKSKKDRED